MPIRFISAAATRHTSRDDSVVESGSGDRAMGA
jgi:hypothetical protein